jgi:alanyl-tRNA synthetase
LVKNAEVVKDIKIITQVMENLDIDLLRKNIDLIKAKTSNTIIALGSKVNGRALLVMGVTEDLCRQGIDAAKLIKDVAKFIGGSGGGRSDFAQAGGNNPENFEKAFHELKNIISKS